MLGFYSISEQPISALPPVVLPKPIVKTPYQEPYQHGPGHPKRGAQEQRKKKYSGFEEWRGPVYIRGVGGTASQWQAGHASVTSDSPLVVILKQSGQSIGFVSSIALEHAKPEACGFGSDILHNSHVSHPSIRPSEHAQIRQEKYSRLPSAVGSPLARVDKPMSLSQVRSIASLTAIGAPAIRLRRGYRQQAEDATLLGPTVSEINLDNQEDRLLSLLGVVDDV